MKTTIPLKCTHVRLDCSWILLSSQREEKKGFFGFFLYGNNAYIRDVYIIYNENEYCNITNIVWIFLFQKYYCLCLGTPKYYRVPVRPSRDFLHARFKGAAYGILRRVDFFFTAGNNTLFLTQSTLVSFAPRIVLCLLGVYGVIYSKSKTHNCNVYLYSGQLCVQNKSPCTLVIL